MRRPDITIRNALIIPLLPIRALLILAGCGVEWLGRAIRHLGGLIPGWTNDGQAGGMR